MTTKIIGADLTKLGTIANMTAEIYNADRENNYQDGYNDGVAYHQGLNFPAKDEDRYDDNEDYRRGFDEAGDDS